MDGILFLLCVSLTARLSTSTYCEQLFKHEGQLHYEGWYFRHTCAKEDSKMCHSPHILKEPHFWAVFSCEVEIKKSWKCPFHGDVMKENLKEDAALYDDDSVFRRRREGVAEWVRNDTLWSTVVLGACKELSEEKEGEFVLKLKNLHLLEALQDFVDHIKYFYQVAAIMSTRGEDVLVLGPNTSTIHDIDKLDPIMLVGYSERFEDNQTTSLWQKCVDHHTKGNPHHQAHCIWSDCCRCGTPATNNTKVCVGCDSVRNIALREMVCDKVSRRMQKELNGEVSDTMWDTDMGFYKGLSAQWIEKATALLQYLKYWNRV